MDETRMKQITEQFLEAWNSQDVERVVAWYTDDLKYIDPNTRGAITDPEALSRYLTKLFAVWKMHWSAREIHLLDGGNGCAVLWHAVIKKADRDEAIEIGGMDLITMQGDHIKRNEVYFDRAALLPLLKT